MVQARSASDDAARAIGLAIAAFGPLLVVGALVSFRDDIASANVALVFVVVVVLGAAIGHPLERCGRRNRLGDVLRLLLHPLRS